MDINDADERFIKELMLYMTIEKNYDMIQAKILTTHIMMLLDRIKGRPIKENKSQEI